MGETRNHEGNPHIAYRDELQHATKYASLRPRSPWLSHG